MAALNTLPGPFNEKNNNNNHHQYNNNIHHDDDDDNSNDSDDINSPILHPVYCRHDHQTPLASAGFIIHIDAKTYPSSSHLDVADHQEHAPLTLLTANESTVQRRRASRHDSLFIETTSSQDSLCGKGAGITRPQSVAVRGLGRSVSLPIVDDAMLASVSVESVVEESSSTPGSPPDLTYSKSSKSSSSLNSDDDICAAGQDGGLSKHGHFDEVVLEEDCGSDGREDNNLPPDSRPTLRRPAPRALATGGAVVARRRSGTSPPLRPLTNGIQQSKYPSLQGAVSGVLQDQSLNLPQGRTMQRAVSSPLTSPSMRPHPQHILSRSPSPNKLYAPKSPLGSPQTLATSTPKASYESQGSATRKPAWQPRRKSTKELEAEYNDEDEDVPDDAILENVPVSPLPGHYSVARSPNLTPNSMRSATPSPNRRPGPYANMHSANIPKGAKRPSAPPSSMTGMPRSPKFHHRPKMQHSSTVGAFPLDSRCRQYKSKSWTEDLNREARELSQKLEEYAERLSLDKKSTTPSGANSVANSPPRLSSNKPARLQTTVLEIPSIPSTTLPPIQRGNIMIDPLPISKEKEAVLSRTRPSWLPPKDQKEERKHLKEFQQMMARAAESERKRALKEQTNREDKQEMQGSIARIWEQHVLPNWDVVVQEPRTRELWWRGVTPSNRGEVWSRAIGNELELSTASFDAALARAHTLEAKIANMPAEEKANCREAAWLEAIDRDVPNTLPDARMCYNAVAPLHQNLSDVLKAYTLYRSDVGYVYGIHLIAGNICLTLPAADAFVLLANMLNRPLPLAFLVHDEAAMQRTYELTLQTLRYKYTRLHDHLTSPALGLKPEEFLDPIYRCLFAYNLPHEYVARIWDIFVFEGDKALVRAAVAVLSQLESKLYGSREEVLHLIGWVNQGNFPVESEDAFINAIREAGKVERRSASA